MLMFSIHWKIGKATGHGEPIDFDLAIAWIESLNKSYGPGTHWIVEVY
jgi:hypothetical protein